MTAGNENENEKENTNVNYPLQITGLIFFITAFLFVAILLYKNKHYAILEGYLPNIDLMATAASWQGGPRNSLKRLYLMSPVTAYDDASQVLINYLALLGLTYIITRESKETRSTAKGWSMGFVMLLMTYLLPSKFIIIPIMSYVNDLNIFHRFNKVIISGVGFITTFVIIYVETLILKYFKDHLYKAGKAILRIPKLLQ